jgi:tripartite-type tricarboxylate transporter receptor subunit TctC
MRAHWLALMCVTLALAAPARSDAQDFPVRTVRLIVPFAAGGTPDVVARLVAHELDAQTGQSFVVENRGGADGLIGAQAVAEAAPDGYTLLVTSSSFVINPSFHKKLPFDVVRDFEPVTNITATEAFILGVNPDFSARSVQELIALARAPDSRISFGSPGVGNVLHLMAELFRARTATRMVHVPYKGAAPAITGLIGGEVQMMFLTPPSSLQQIEAGKIRALAYTGNTRMALLPAVPTMAEAGITGMDAVTSWTGMFAPARTPPAILDRLHAQVSKALAAPAMRERLAQLGLAPIGNPPAEFKPYVAAQVQSIADIVRAAGIAPP